MAIQMSTQTEPVYVQYTKATKGQLSVANTYSSILKKLLQEPQRDQQKLHAALEGGRVAIAQLDELLRRLKSVPSEHLPRSEQRRRQSEVSRLVKQYQKVINTWNASTREISGVTNGSDSHEEMDPYEDMDEPQQSNALQRQADLDSERLLSERSALLEGVEQDARTVVEMMRDLNVIIEQVQPVLDLIDDNIIVTKDEVKRSQEELTQLAASTHSGRQRRFWCGVVCLLASLIFIWAIFAPNN
eukprot:gb/GEZN01018079.1/.p1 GENE.gb/GEZN01018079.1/~~gb/GEZN01018079.1/.p1  ORF type:complete len:251 (+),score=18.59 gb/GEZN01018079.1/:24-755(+)